jgi:3-deoxy-D-manno-octulosonic-acid transferase
VCWYPVLALAGALQRAAPADRRERLGVARLPSGGPEARTLWVHGASVGEIEALVPVLLRLAELCGELRLVVTSMTVAGRAHAARRIPSALAHLLAPWDSAPCVRGFLRAVRPCLLLIAETELWPNYFVESRRYGARVALVNARLSRRAFGLYRWAGPLFARALEAADLVLAQTEEDARRFVRLGARPDRVSAVGNTKFDPAAFLAAPLSAPLGALLAGRTVFVAGSTAPGEEEVVIEAYRELGRQFPSLALVLAPRHLERAGEVEALLRRYDVSYIRASQAPRQPAAGPKLQALLLDTMGELRAAYAVASVAFVGGSLKPGRGGQNLAEPAALGVPVIFGPFHENQRASAERLLAAGAGCVVDGRDAMARACARWLGDADAHRRASGAGIAAVRALAGAAATAAERLASLLDGAAEGAGQTAAGETANTSARSAPGGAASPYPLQGPDCKA